MPSGPNDLLANGACADLEDLFRRKWPPAHVEVHASGYRVCLKAGVSVVVRAWDA